MKGLTKYHIAGVAITVAVLLISGGYLLAKNEGDAPLDTGPKVVILNELENEYEPVPFDHLAHARMAQMWSGCETCHHYSPHPSQLKDNWTTSTIVSSLLESTVTPPTEATISTILMQISSIDMATTVARTQTQRASILFPACKFCHSESLEESEIPLDELPIPRRNDAARILQRKHGLSLAVINGRFAKADSRNIGRPYPIP